MDFATEKDRLSEARSRAEIDAILAKLFAHARVLDNLGPSERKRIAIALKVSKLAREVRRIQHDVGHLCAMAAKVLCDEWRQVLHISSSETHASASSSSVGEGVSSHQSSPEKLKRPYPLVVNGFAEDFSKRPKLVRPCATQESLPSGPEEHQLPECFEGPLSDLVAPASKIPVRMNQLGSVKTKDGERTEEVCFTEHGDTKIGDIAARWLKDCLKLPQSFVPHSAKEIAAKGLIVVDRITRWQFNLEEPLLTAFSGRRCSACKEEILAYAYIQKVDACCFGCSGAGGYKEDVRQRGLDILVKLPSDWRLPTKWGTKPTHNTSNSMKCQICRLPFSFFSVEKRDGERKNVPYCKHCAV